MAIPFDVSMNGLNLKTGEGVDPYDVTDVLWQPTGVSATGYIGGFTRASPATYHDATGLLQTVGNDVRRYAYDPVSLNPLGLLLEAASSNLTRNPLAEGAVNGSPGTLPTNWSIPNGLGLIRTIVGRGYEDGIPYIDIRFNGTSTAAIFQMQMDTATAIPAATGQVWVASAYVRLVAGTTTNFVAISIVQYFNDSSGTLLTTSGNNADTASLPTNAPLRTQRYASSASPTNANTAFTNGCGLRLNVSTSQSYDFTLRIGSPQTELLTNTINLMPLIGGGWTCSNAIASSWQPDPVGTSRAVFVTDTATVITHYYQGVSGTIPNNQPITFSVYMRDGGRRYCRLQLYDTSASGNQTAFTVDLQTASITASPNLGGQATNVSASITAVGNGWNRVVCTVTLSTTVDTTVSFRAFLSNTSGTGTSYGDGTGKGIYLWGAQVESASSVSAYQSSEATSPILPPIGSPGISTRAADFLATPITTISLTDTGVAGVGQLSTAVTLCTTAISGATATANIGAVRATAAESPVGVASTVAIGSLTIRTDSNIAMVGVAASGGIGTPNKQVSGTSIVGLAATGNAGTASLQITDALIGVTAAATATTLTPSRIQTIIGISARGRAGAFTRSSIAYYHDVNGVLQIADIDVERYAYDPVTSYYIGPLIESATTNYTRNPRGENLVAGAPGTYPTNWSFSTLATGTTREMVGSGIENGIPYVDIRVSGTPSTAIIHLLTDTTTGIPAMSGQQWGTSVYCSLAAGSTANWVFFGLLGYFTSSTGTVLVNAGATTDAASFPTGAPLRMQRYTNTMIPTNDSIACTAGVGIRIQVATGSPIDFTLRIGAPQAEILTSSPANFVAPVGGSWASSNAVATSFQTDIVGTSHAVFVTDNAITNLHHYSCTSGTLPANQQNTCSIYVKDGGRRYLRFQIYDTSNSGNQVNMTVDLLAGLVTQAPTNTGAATGAIGGVFPVGAGWFRVWLSATLQTGVGTTTTFRILLYNTPTNGSYADGTGLGLYFCRPQIQAGPLTEYISNEVSSVILPPSGSPGISTRAADNLPSMMLLSLPLSSVVTPAIVGGTVQRPSSATYFDSNGVLQVVGNDTGRDAYDPVTLNPIGLLLETASTNWVRNPRGMGGIEGTATLPTYWTVTNTGTALFQTIGTGIEDGIPYADIRCYGATNGNFGFQFETATGIPASLGQVWSVSLYIRLIDGSIPATTAGVSFNGYNSSGGSAIGYGGAASTGLVPTLAPLRTQRLIGSGQITNSATAFIGGPRLGLTLTPGTIDFTIRIGCPQTELLSGQNIGWMISNGYVPTNGTVTYYQSDPFGQSRAILFIDNAISTQHYVNATSQTISPNQQLTFSVFVKDTGRRYLYMTIYDWSNGANYVTAFFDLQTGTVYSVTNGGDASGAKASITPVANATSPGWFRCAVGGMPTNTATDTLILTRMWLISSPPFTTYSGNGTGFYLYGTQLQIGDLTAYSSNDPSSIILPPDDSFSISSRATDNVLPSPVIPYLNPTPTSLSAGTGVGSASTMVDDSFALSGVAGTGTASTIAIRVDETTNLPSIAASGFIGIAAGRVDETLNNATATGLTGTAVTFVDDSSAINGVATSGQIATIYIRIDDTLTPVGATASGTTGIAQIRVDDASALAGLSAIGGISNTLTRVDDTVPVDAVAGSSAIGNLLSRGDVNVFTGITATGTAGSLSLRVDDSFVLTSITAIGNTGSLSPLVDDSIALTGLSAIGSASDTLTRVDDTVPLNAVAASGATGILLSRSDAGKALVGITVSGTAGNFGTRVDDSFALTGLLLNGNLGIVLTQVDESPALTGLSAIGGMGTISTRVDDTVPLNAVAASSATGILLSRSDAGNALIGVIAAGITGSFLPRVDDSSALTGFVAAVAAGIVSIVDSTVLTGLSATGGLGNASTLVDDSSVLTGIAAIGSVGNGLTRTDETGLLSGVIGSSTVGNLLVRDDEVLTGITAMGTAGNLSTRDTIALAGLSASVGLGTIAIRLDQPVTLSGVSSIGLAGLATSRSDEGILIGVPASGRATALTTRTDRSVTLSSVAVSSIVGTLLSRDAATPIAVASASAAGGFTFQLSFTLSSVAAIGNLGSITTQMGIACSAGSAVGLGGVLAIASAEPLGGINTISAAGLARAGTGEPLTSVTASASIGATGSQIGKSISSVSALAAVGSFAFRGDKTFSVLGVIANAQTTTARAQSSPSPLGDVVVGQIGVVGLALVPATLLASDAITGTASSGALYRASPATYVNAVGTMVLVGNDVLRPNFANGRSAGWLIEDASSNLIPNANTTNINWNSTLSTDIPPLYPPASLWRMTSPGGTASSFNYAAIAKLSITASTIYTISAWVYLPIGYADSAIKIDFDSTGHSDLAIVNTNTAITGQWQRISRTVLSDSAATSMNIVLRSVSDSSAGAISYTACWQLEQSTTPTSYIPTSGIPAFRAADTGFVPLPSITLQLPAVSAAASIGLAPGIQGANPSGVQAAGLVNIVSTRQTIVLPSSSGTAVVGAVISGSPRSITGIASAGAIGSLGKSVNLIAVGIQTNGSPGITTAVASLPNNGVVASAAVGNLASRVDDTGLPVGVAAIGNISIASAGVAVAQQGTSAIGAIGSLSMSIGDAASPLGATAQGTGGLLAKSINATFSGVFASGTVGSPSTGASQAVMLSGVTANGISGTLSNRVDDTIGLVGVACTAGGRSLATKADKIGSLSGVQASASTATLTNKVAVASKGASLQASAGVPKFSIVQQRNTAPNGAAATTKVGLLGGNKVAITALGISGDAQLGALRNVRIKDIGQYKPTILIVT